MKYKKTMQRFAVAVTVALSATSALAITPMAVEFANPTAGVTAPLLGGSQKYTLRLVRVGQTLEGEPIMGLQMCQGLYTVCKRVVGSNLPLYVDSMQAVQLVDAADRPTIVGYDGWTLTLCHTTSNSSAAQGMACSQTPWRTTAKPYAVRGIAGGQNSYSVAFGAPVAPAQHDGGSLAVMNVEITRNEGFVFQVKGLALAAAQAAGVPMTRKGPACSDDSVDANSTTAHDAHAMRIVPLCVGGGGGEDVPGTTEPINEPPSDVTLPPVQVTCKKGNACWPLPIVQVIWLDGKPPVSVGVFPGESTGGDPLPKTPTPSQGSGPNGKPSIQDPKALCMEGAAQRNRVRTQTCAKITAQIAGGTFGGALGAGIALGTVGWLTAKLPGAAAGFIAGFGGVALTGNQLGDLFSKACASAAQDAYVADTQACNGANGQ